jgi:two-component system, LytTR family, sensor histidine kinase AlgZ
MPYTDCARGSEAATARKPQGLLRELTGILIANTLISIALALVFSWAYESLTRTRLLAYFITCFVITQCIGTLAAVAVPRLIPWLERFAQALRLVLLLAILIAVATIGFLAANALLVPLGFIQPASYWSRVAAGLPSAVAITIIIGVAVTFFEKSRGKLREATETLRMKELERERALKLASEAQLLSLESRIHPHFLFNAINSILSLIREDPVRAEQMLERLASLLRFSLDAHRRGLIPLSEELRIAADYLEIEKARFGDRLRFGIEASGIDNVEVPPHTVQVLVENSVKHHVSRQRKGGEVRILARLDGAEAVIEVWDDGAGFSRRDFLPGHGLQTLQDRLETLFGGAARLEIEPRPGESRVRVVLPASHFVRES